MAVTLEVNVYDTNGTTKEFTGDQKKLIRYYSHAYCEITSVASPYPVDNDLLIIRNGNETRYGWNGTFENVESNIFTFSAEDANGDVGTVTYKATMLPYFKPTCIISNNQPDTTGKVYFQCHGTFYNANFGQMDNTLTVCWRYKKWGDSDGNWQTLAVNKEYNSYYGTKSFTIPNFDPKAEYVFECYAQDLLTVTQASPISVKNTPVFHWGKNDFAFEVPVAVNGDVDITGDLSVGDGGLIRCKDGQVIITSNSIHLDSPWVAIGDEWLPDFATGEWTPTLNSGVISSYTTQKGWYSKVGQTVTVGFFIKANCRSGYETVHIEIFNLPYNPAYSSAGGGMCSGAYVGANKTFQCFVAEPGWKITTRVQACNNTIDTNLSTSSVGCNYRSGGGEITLSGTITYITS